MVAKFNLKVSNLLSRVISGHTKNRISFYIPRFFIQQADYAMNFEENR